MPHRSFDLTIRADGAIHPVRATLSLAADGTLDWGSDPVALSDPRDIRLSVVVGPLARRTGAMELTFLHRPPLIVGGGTVTGAPDAGQAGTYRAFVTALHKAIPTDTPVAFRRGLKGGSPRKGWIAFAVAAAVDIALVAFLLTRLREDAAPFVQPAIILFGIAGLVGAAGLGQAMAGRSYDPRRLPVDLLP